ncbi:MAG: hypothetical protein DRP42_02385 [Tenericutes bacterium]|nr:MAG: hypothetical protein DRP42_02385 [Mycoplasmatota bacterium]
MEYLKVGRTRISQHALQQIVLDIMDNTPLVKLLGDRNSILEIDASANINIRMTIKLINPSQAKLSINILQKKIAERIFFFAQKRPDLVGIRIN